MIELWTEIGDAVRSHARACAPLEACGLLAGVGQRIEMAYCLDNVDLSPVRFTVDPYGHIGALRHAESNGWEIIGVFHSHPNGPARPSRSDIAGALEPEWYHLIVSPEQMSAFRIIDGVVLEEPIRWLPAPDRPLARRGA